MSPAELAIVSDELPVAIWMGRVPSGEVVYTNRAFREVLGIESPPGAARGEFVEPYGVHTLDGQPYPESQMPFERAIAARTTVVVDDLVIHRHDGRHVNLRVLAKPLFDADGNITHILEAFTDITREVEAERARVEGERKLARTQRLESIGQLVMGVAHDFNNLLTVTMLTTSRLLQKLRDEDHRTSLTDIATVTSSAAELVRKLVGFAQRAPHPLVPIELGAIVQSVVAISQRTFDPRLQMSAACAPGAWIRGDHAQLEQVLMNLLVNARDAIGGAGKIVVTTSIRTLAAGEIETCPAGTYVVLETSDDGPGIDPAIRERVFEPYFTTKTRGPVKGTGLGLSTVLGIVRTHGGFLEAGQVSPHGTNMRIAFPLHHQPETAIASAVPRIDRPIIAGNGKLVLVVDDEPLVRTATASTVRSLGYRTLEAEGGAQAIDVFATHADGISAVILDMLMPGAPARDVYAALRSRRADIPVILVTGASVTSEVDALLDQGIRTWLAKPFELAEFAQVLSTVLESAT